MRLVFLLSAMTALAGAAQAADRYGATSPPSAQPLPAPATAAKAPASPTAGGPRILTWSGKTQPTAPAEVVEAQADGPPAPLPAPPPQGAWRRPGPGAQTGAPQPLAAPPPRYAAQPAPQAAPPASLYGAAQPQPPQQQAQAQAAPYAGGPRFYSLHREYGVAPDPIPQAELSGQTTDLAAPPPPVDKRTPAQQRAAVAQADSGVGNAPSGSQGGDWGASDDPGLAGGDPSQALTAQAPAQTGLGAPQSSDTNADSGSGHP